MTKKEAIRQNAQEHTLLSLGFTVQEAEILRRISLTLHRWFEHECNGAIQRDGDAGDGKPFWYNTNTGEKIGPAPDREAGAMKRLKQIIGARNAREVRQTFCDRCGLDIEGIAPFAEWRDRGNNAGDEHHRHAPPTDGSWGPLTFYIQSDPRGAVLYIIRPGDVPEGKDVSAYYSRGICVY